MGDTFTIPDGKKATQLQLRSPSFSPQGHPTTTGWCPHTPRHSGQVIRCPSSITRAQSHSPIKHLAGSLRHVGWVISTEMPPSPVGSQPCIVALGLSAAVVVLSSGAQQHLRLRLSLPPQAVPTLSPREPFCPLRGVELALHLWRSPAKPRCRSHKFKAGELSVQEP